MNFKIPFLIITSLAIGILLGYKLSATEKFELGRKTGENHGTISTILKIDSVLGYRVNDKKNEIEKTKDSDYLNPQILIKIKDISLYTIEINGVKTLAIYDY